MVLEAQGHELRFLTFPSHLILELLALGGIVGCSRIPLLIDEVLCNKGKHLITIYVDWIDITIVFTNACANSRYMRQSADQHPWVHAWRDEEHNPRAKAKGFLGSGPVISNAPGCEVRIPAPTHKGLYTQLSTTQWRGLRGAQPSAS